MTGEFETSEGGHVSSVQLISPGRSRASDRIVKVIAGLVVLAYWSKMQTSGCTQQERTAPARMEMKGSGAAKMN
jgi:hypothetical protein